MVNRTSLTVIQLNDSHAYFDLHQEMFWQGGQAVYRPAGGYARIAAIVKQIRVANQERVASSAGTPDPSGSDRVLIQLADALGDGDAGQSTGAADPRDAPVALMHGLVRRHHSPAALIQMPPDSRELSLEGSECFDAPTLACSGSYVKVMY